jgi:hypothetical protein
LISLRNDHTDEGHYPLNRDGEMNAPLRNSQGLAAKIAQLHEGTKDRGMAGERKNGRNDRVMTDGMTDAMIAEMSGVVKICGTI